MMKLAKVFYIFYNINYKQYKINYALNQDHSSLQKFWNFLDAYPKKVHQNQNRRSRLCQRTSPTTAYFLRHLFRKWGGQIREYIGGGPMYVTDDFPWKRQQNKRHQFNYLDLFNYLYYIFIWILWMHQESGWIFCVISLKKPRAFPESGVSRMVTEYGTTGWWMV